MVFNSPRDVAGTGCLSFSYDDESKDDDIWLYLPAMKRVRRITGSGKNDDFMGTDFTYEDRAVCCASAQNRIKIHGSEFLCPANCIRTKGSRSPIIEDFLHIYAKNPQAQPAPDMMCSRVKYFLTTIL
jgi:hypothetical protein